MTILSSSSGLGFSTCSKGYKRMKYMKRWVTAVMELPVYENKQH